MSEAALPAQTNGGRTPEALLAEESSLALPSCNEMDAIAIGERILGRAIQAGLPVTIEVRRGSRVVFRAALPGTTPDNDDWVARKVRVVERFGHSSLYCRVVHEAAGTTFHAKTGLPEREYAAHGGAVPLVVAGTGMVGIAIVSGLPDVDDHDLVVAGIREHLAGIAAVAAAIDSAAAGQA
jgi:uncharacterized protein (UPF0303 family)